MGYVQAGNAYAYRQVRASRQAMLSRKRKRTRTFSDTSIPRVERGGISAAQ